MEKTKELWFVVCRIVKMFQIFIVFLSFFIELSLNFRKVRLQGWNLIQNNLETSNLSIL